MIIDAAGWQTDAKPDMWLVDTQKLNPKTEVSAVDIEPKLKIRFEVVAYDDGGYGDNRTRDFATEDEAVAAYARGLEARFHPSIWKRITMEPISIRIPH